jgi:hypothetical protein
MSMIGNFRRISDAKLNSLLAEPDTITDFLYPEEENADAPESEAFADLDVDKAWHGIHCLLTGTAWEGEPPLGFIVSGGQEIGDVDVGYGPARGFTSAEVRAIAGALSALDRDALLARYDPAAMNQLEIYPASPDGWPPRDKDEDGLIEYLTDYYDMLRDFVLGAAKEGEALLVYLN